MIHAAANIVPGEPIAFEASLERAHAHLVGEQMHEPRLRAPEALGKTLDRLIHIA
jgi:hypothetical protein